LSFFSAKSSLPVGSWSKQTKNGSTNIHIHQRRRRKQKNKRNKKARKKKARKKEQNQAKQVKEREREREKEMTKEEREIYSENERRLSSLSAARKAESIEMVSVCVLCVGDRGWEGASLVGAVLRGR